MWTVNRAQCRHCLSIIESKSVHDMQYCRCGACAVDGGQEYLRRLVANGPDDLIEMSIKSNL